MVRRILVSVLGLALLGASAGPVRASHPDGAIRDGGPELTEGESSQSIELEQARRRLDDAVRSFWRAYEMGPWDLGALWDAYTVYAAAWWEHQTALACYRRRGGVPRDIAGVVLERERSPRTREWVERPVADALVRLYTAPSGQGLPGSPALRGTDGGASADPRAREPLMSSQGPPPLDSASPPAVSLVGTRTTDAQGRFAFAGLARRPYRYSVSRDGYVTRSGHIRPGAGGADSVFYLERIRVLEGVVMAGPAPGGNPGGAPGPVPLAGARVTVELNALAFPSAGTPEEGAVPPEAGGRASFSAVTGVDGRFRLERIPFRQVVLSVTMDGYRTHTAGLALDREVTERTVVLQRDGTPATSAGPERFEEELIRAGAGVDNPFR